MMPAPISIALAEDSVSDAALLRLALAQTGARITLVHFLNGTDLLRNLGLENGEEARLPYALVLLDLNLPGMTGFDVLERIRSADHLAETPIIVLSG